MLLLSSPPFPPPHKTKTSKSRIPFFNYLFPTSIQKLKSPIPGSVRKENDPRILTIQGLYDSIAPDLQGINVWRYQRQISSGVQEYIEATSFQHYLETQHLITLKEAQATIPGGIVLTEKDYLLGLFDLVGEMMKFAITNMATSGSLPRGGGAPPSPKKDEGQGEEEDVKAEPNGGTDILTDLRSLRTCLSGLDLSPGHASSGGGGSGGGQLEKDVRQKMEVMRTSVEKVERAVYGIIIRGRERWAPDWGADDNNERRRDQLESY